MALILDQRDTWRMRARAAAERVRSTFGAETICSQLEQVYRAALDWSPGRRMTA
jgi:hypothetical protein